jgi:hypothetical protein
MNIYLLRDGKFSNYSPVRALVLRAARRHVDKIDQKGGSGNDSHLDNGMAQRAKVFSELDCE